MLIHVRLIQLSSARSSVIPKHIRNTLFLSEEASSSRSKNHELYDEPPKSAPLSYAARSRSSYRRDSPANVRNSGFFRPSSRLSESASRPNAGDDDDDEVTDVNYDHTIRRAIPTVPHTAPLSQASRPSSFYGPTTPRPTLLFAIASDDVKQVQQVLDSAEAGPNDSAGPQSALAFALTNDQLTHKLDIVKTLLAYGADPASLKAEMDSGLRISDSESAQHSDKSTPSATIMGRMDAATRCPILFHSLG